MIEEIFTLSAFLSGKFYLDMEAFVLRPWQMVLRTKSVMLNADLHSTYGPQNNLGRHPYSLFFFIGSVFFILNLI